MANDAAIAIWAKATACKVPKRPMRARKASNAMPITVDGIAGGTATIRLNATLPLKR